MPLTDVTIRKEKPSSKPVKLTDAHGLYLEVRPSGKKLWRYRYRIAGKENVFAIGEYLKDKSDPNHISLEEARSLRNEARALVKQGVHPSHKRQSERAAQQEANENTFKAVSLLWFEQTRKRKGWTDYYANQITKAFEADVYPYIGSLPISLVGPDHIESILERITDRGANTVALLVRQWCSAVFRFAIRKRKASNDPTIAFKGEVGRKKVRHSTPLSVEEIPKFLKKLDGYGSRTTAIALNLLLLTLARTKELREATWDEFNFDEALWRIPEHRMKARRAHLVPLSRQALGLLNELKVVTGHQQWLFPGRDTGEKPIAPTSLNRALEYLGYAGKFSCHGTRSTASTILNEQGYRGEVIEMSLSHSDKNAVRRSYNQALYLEERRQMIQEWSDFLDALKRGTKIIPIRRNGST
jgi:integrase